MTVILDLLVTRVLAVIVALAVVIWSVKVVERPRGGLVLIGLSVLLLLLIGGGFGLPLLGMIIGLGATRIGAAYRRPPGAVLRGLGLRAEGCRPRARRGPSRHDHVIPDRCAGGPP